MSRSSRPSRFDIDPAPPLPAGGNCPFPPLSARIIGLISIRAVTLSTPLMSCQPPRSDHHEGLNPRKRDERVRDPCTHHYDEDFATPCRSKPFTIMKTRTPNPGHQPTSAASATPLAETWAKTRAPARVTAYDPRAYLIQPANPVRPGTGYYSRLHLPSMVKARSGHAKSGL
jgi:hypothetical protein